MSRANYSVNLDQWDLIRWRGAVSNAIRGKRGQAFLRELLAALDALPAKRLINGYLQDAGNVCALGSVGVRRGLDMAPLDVEDYDTLAETFGVAAALIREIEFENDEAGHWKETPEERFTRVRAWVVSQLQTGE